MTESRMPGEHHHVAEQAEHAAEAVAQGKFGAAVAAEFDLKKSIGGPRGVIESVLPYAVFSLVFAITNELRPSVIAACVPLAVLIVWRLIAREPLTQVFSGVIGIAIGAYVASKTGRASDFFLPSILKNAASAAGAIISALVRWPIVGIFVGPITGEMFEWRKHPARSRVYVLATWIFAALFLVRLAVQIPLWLADETALLGTLNATVLGLPLFALALWLMWLVLRSVPVVKPAEPVILVDPDETPQTPY
ncbi:DUF3159 domain-containing protein [Kineosporia mesophila]|uniref:DUF3159 domain-containing protein n=1 Tax=Kineosporia mesophila TaxID=566012 RepID=A0ABP7ASA2_9ACTN|nr:DUF3159 domain-containing protein [Kineosporia mesophila]MCD5353106.1 DUF3159 domain-containing protein [Kineosporia mesophila]